MSGILDYLANQKSRSRPVGFKLPLMHTANGEDFVTILKDREIKLSKCRIFKNDNLAYFFLGRPAYKTEISFDPSYWQLPAVFIFNEITNHSPKRIFPFDSGAFADERFRAIIGRLEIKEFFCGTDLAIGSDIIRTFFETSTRYRRAQPISYETISLSVGDKLSNFAPLALAKLYNANFNNEIDDRARLIEIQYDEPVRLELPDLAGVICCKEWLRDPEIQKIVVDLGCRVSTYPILPLSTSSYYAKIYELAESYDA